ncbi:MAG: hypothetical protein JXO22_07970 [Phycisphaerae bacterium]|nr:hypothetical protein [Phycisphaerae bacterium]
MHSVRALLSGMLFAIAGTTCGACTDQHRSTLDIRTPRVYLWSSTTPASLRSSMETQGVVVHELNGDGAGLFVVTGTGTVQWPSVHVDITEAAIVVNNVCIESAADAYRNVTVYEDGRVVPDKFAPFER